LSPPLLLASLNVEPESHPKSLTQPDLDKLIKDQDAVIPWIRLSERLKNIKDASHQAITDFLSDHGISSLLRIHLSLLDLVEGHINGRILDILRTTDVERISLVNSLFDENGLNLCGKDLFPGMLLPLYPFYLPPCFVDPSSFTQRSAPPTLSSP